MNILVVAHYQGDGSPTASFIHNQVKAFRNMGHAVQVISPVAIGKSGYASTGRFHGGRQEIDGIPHYYLRYLSLSSYGQRRFNTQSAIAALRGQLNAILTKFSPDIIHAHTLGFDSEIGAWLKQRLCVPLVVTTHGSDSSVPLERGEYAYMKRLCHQADHIVAVSSVLARKLKSCGTNVPVSSILNGFALQYLPEKQEKQALSFLQVGFLLKQKRFDITIRAFAKFRTVHHEAVLTVVGQGEERERLESLCLELGVADAVRFTGQIPNSEVLAEMAKHQFFVMPSIREGFGIVYLEAMACGCITIGTQGEGITDLIRNGENGFLVPPDDPDAIVRIIEKCLCDEKLVEHVSSEGIASAMELTWSANAGQYIELFNELHR